jgi:hypothetical protein
MPGILRFTKQIFLLLITAGSILLRAEVTDSSASGFTVKNIVYIATNSNDVYNQLIDVKKWWSSAHTFSGDANNLSIDPKAGGCFCEQLSGGGSVRHLEVVYANPGKVLRMVGALGPMQSMAVTGSITFNLSEENNLTKVEVIYTVGGYRPGGLNSLAPVVDRVLLAQLNRLKNYIEKGKPEND